MDPLHAIDLPPAPGFPAELALRCRGVTKVYGEGGTRVAALRGVDLDVRRRELLMLVGPSGCGKTTLISVMAGILDHDEGECLVFGKDLRGMSQRRRTRFRGEHVGFVFQSFNLIPALSAAENVSVPLLLRGATRAQALGRARELLHRVGLADRERSLPGQLSGGQQQRVAIARALVHDPQLVVCDEPTSSLDYVNGQKIMEILRGLAADGERALVVVSHDARIYPFADRIAEMEDGRITRLADPPAHA